MLRIACVVLAVAAVLADHRSGSRSGSSSSSSSSSSESFEWRPPCQQMMLEHGMIRMIRSHDEYGVQDYQNDYFKCWEIYAPEGYAVRAKVMRFDLADDDDVVTAACGGRGNRGYIGSFYSEDLEQGDEVVVPGHLYTEFESNRRGQAAGFEAELEVVEMSEVDDDICEDSWSDSDSWEDEEDAAVAITAIVMFFLFLGVVVVSCAACCFCCFKQSVRMRYKFWQRQQPATVSGEKYLPQYEKFPVVTVA